MPNDESLVDLFMSARNGLARVAMKIVPPSDVEDIVQETYVRLCRASVVNEIRSPRSFMLKTAKNLALDHVKRAEFRLADPIGDAEQNSALPMAKDTLDQVCSDENFSIFCAAVRELPVQCRRAFVLRKVYGCSQREIAEEMQISEKTVEGHVANGITRCKRIIAKKSTGRAPIDSSKADHSSITPGQEKS